MQFSDWNNTNELRNYPLDDLANKRDDHGNELPDDLLADVQLIIPSSAGKYVFVSSVAITKHLVSITFAATDGPIIPVAGDAAGASSIPLCSLSLTKPVDIFRNYSIEAIYPGVAGWVMFGGAAAEQSSISLIFSDPAATTLVPKAASYFEDLPVNYLGKVGAASQLTGLIKLKAGNNIAIEGEDRVINGELKRVILIHMNTDVETQETLKAFSGVCGKRPDDRTCSRESIQQINGVAPDCDGNIQIDVLGDIPWGAVVSGGQEDGLIFHYPLGFVDVCVDTLQLRDRNDICESSYSSIGPEPPYSSSSLEPSSSSSAGPALCPDIPGAYTEDFSSSPACFTEQSGSWSTTGGEYFGSNSTSRGLSTLVGSHSKGRCIETQMGVLAGTLLKSYMIFSYVDSQNFWYIKVDVNSQLVSIGRVKSGLEQDAINVSESLAINTLYDIKIEVASTGTDSGEVSLWIGGVLRTALTVSNDLYDGRVGYGIKQSNGYFDNLAISLI